MGRATLVEQSQVAIAPLQVYIYEAFSTHMRWATRGDILHSFMTPQLRSSSTCTITTTQGPNPDTIADLLWHIRYLWILVKLHRYILIHICECVCVYFLLFLFCLPIIFMVNARHAACSLIFTTAVRYCFLFHQTVRCWIILGILPSYPALNFISLTNYF